MNSSNNIDHFTTNGLLFPTLSFPTGQRKRFRYLNFRFIAILRIIFYVYHIFDFGLLKKSALVYAKWEDSPYRMNLQ